MKILLVFDTVQGNTDKIARAMASALIPFDVKLMRPGEVTPADFQFVDWLIVGSPTMGGRPTRAMQSFLSGLSGNTLNNINAVAFDTRLTAGWVKIFGYAAGRIAGSLESKGAKLAAPPEGFFILDSKGPLKEGELERAGEWIRAVIMPGK